LGMTTEYSPPPARVREDGVKCFLDRPRRRRLGGSCCLALWIGLLDEGCWRPCREWARIFRARRGGPAVALVGSL